MVQYLHLTVTLTTILKLLQWLLDFRENKWVSFVSINI